MLSFQTYFECNQPVIWDIFFKNKQETLAQNKTAILKLTKAITMINFTSSRGLPSPKLQVIEKIIITKFKI